MIRLSFTVELLNIKRTKQFYFFRVVSIFVSLILAACDSHKGNMDINEQAESQTIETNRRDITEDKQNKRLQPQQNTTVLTKKVASKTIESKTVESKKTAPKIRETNPKTPKKTDRKPLDLRLDDVTLSSIQENCQSNSFDCSRNNKNRLPNLFTKKEADRRLNISGDLERDAEKELLDIKAIKGGEVSIEYKFQ